MKTESFEFRLLLKNGIYLNAGTGLDSWFNLKTARELKDKHEGSQIRWISKHGDMGEVM